MKNLKIYTILIFLGFTFLGFQNCSNMDAAMLDEIGVKPNAPEEPMIENPLEPSLPEPNFQVTQKLKKGTIVQEVYVLGNKNDQFHLPLGSQPTYKDTSLVASITPLYKNSIIEAEALIRRAQASYKDGPEHANRSASMRIFNETEQVGGPPSSFGRFLEQPTKGPAHSMATVPLRMRHKPSSKQTQTFRVQYGLSQPGMLVETKGDKNPPYLRLREIIQ